MNYRGKDKLAEALMNGLLKTPVKKEVAPIVVDKTTVAKPLVESQSHSDTRNMVAESLKPNTPEWAKKLVEKKALVEQVVVPVKARKSVEQIASTIRLNKVEEKSLILNESTDSISSVLSNRGKRLFKEAKKETMEEAIARLDEISRGTLARYTKLAHYDQIKNHKEKDKNLRTYHKNKDKDSNPSPFMSGDPAAKEFQKRDDVNFRKIGNRAKGMNRALSRLAKEEVEHLDEISQSTLNSYGDKAFKSKINAHVDKGAAEFHKDGPEYEKQSKIIAKRDKGMDMRLNKILGKK